MRGRPAAPRSRLRWAVVLAALAVTFGGLWATTRPVAPIDPRWQSVSVRVPDLDCAFWCSVKLTTALDAVAGIRAEAFDAQQQTVRVRFDPDRYAAPDVREVLRARGFRIDADEGPGLPR